MRVLPDDQRQQAPARQKTQDNIYKDDDCMWPVGLEWLACSLRGAVCVSVAR